MICTFASKINEIASDIVYELHDFNEKYYTIKWKIGKNEHKIKEKKSIVNKMFEKEKYIKQ